MSDTASADPASSRTPRHLLSLPRELRDYIHTLSALPSPKSYGPLSGYVEPETSLLRVNRQVRAEYQPVFYKLLPDVLNQNRVCLELPTSGTSRRAPEHRSKKFCCGWQFWKVPGTPWYERDTSSGQRRLVEGGLQVWVHRVPEEVESELRWWMDVYQVGAENHLVGNKKPQLSREVKELAALLERIRDHSKIAQGRLGRVARVLWKLLLAIKGEDEERMEKGVGSLVGSMSSLRVPSAAGDLGKTGSEAASDGTG